ncbi:aromatic amino acid ammonia-lyase [Leifsonia sp. YIM 134122]|uniref:Aromatic amino acid ammonia-lyase n=1 Tax=Leifsonia stereocauli TaxID=3134136 RepID=A0ABU9VZL6_9MICO
MAGPVELGADPATPFDIASIAAGAAVSLAPAALVRVRAARDVVERTLASGASVYGLTTRLGSGRDERLADDELIAYQRQVVANHRGGSGPLLPPTEVRAVIAARLALLLNGGSGVRVEVIEALARLLDADSAAVDVPSRGSVGAADLALLAPVLAELLERGLDLAPQEAAAFLSANAYSIGVGCLVAGELDGLGLAADRAVALTLQAAGLHGTGGAISPFSVAVQQARGGVGQAASAARIRGLIADGNLFDSAREVTVQDPLSVRTAPQVTGAFLERVDALRTELSLELAARSENPVVDITSASLVSGGNFAALPLTLALETLRLALAHVAAASERRIAVLSELQRPFRAAGTSVLPGLTWYGAAGALAEIRQLAAPVSLGATVLSGVEDTASFAPTALQLLRRSAELTRDVLAIEALHAAELVRLDDASSRLGAASAPLAEALIALLESGVASDELVARAGIRLSKEDSTAGD